MTSTWSATKNETGALSTAMQSSASNTYQASKRGPSVHLRPPTEGERKDSDARGVAYYWLTAEHAIERYPPVSPLTHDAADMSDHDRLPFRWEEPGVGWLTYWPKRPADWRR